MDVVNFLLLLWATSAMASLTAINPGTFGNRLQSFSKILTVPCGVSCGHKDQKFVLSREEKEINYSHSADDGLWGRIYFFMSQPLYN